MSDENTISRPNGKFVKGASGNPGGQHKEIIAVKRMLRSSAAQACEELIRLTQEAKSEQLKLAAIKILLEFVIGKPKVAIDVSSDLHVSIVQLLTQLTPAQREERAKAMLSASNTEDDKEE